VNDKTQVGVNKRNFRGLTFAKIFDTCRNFDVNDNTIIVETSTE